jgi:hypothetical protein
MIVSLFRERERERERERSLFLNPLFEECNAPKIRQCDEERNKNKYVI